MRSVKARSTRSVAVNITLPPLLYQKLQQLVVSHGFKGPSDFFQQTIRVNSGLALSNECKAEN